MKTLLVILFTILSFVTAGYYGVQNFNKKTADFLSLKKELKKQKTLINKLMKKIPKKTKQIVQKKPDKSYQLVKSVEKLVINELKTFKGEVTILKTQVKNTDKNLSDLKKVVDNCKQFCKKNKLPKKKSKPIKKVVKKKKKIKKKKFNRKKCLRSYKYKKCVKNYLKIWDKFCKNPKKPIRISERRKTSTKVKNYRMNNDTVVEEEIFYSEYQPAINIKGTPKHDYCWAPRNYSTAFCERALCFRWKK